MTYRIELGPLLDWDRPPADAEPPTRIHLEALTDRLEEARCLECGGPLAPGCLLCGSRECSWRYHHEPPAWRRYFEDLLASQQHFPAEAGEREAADGRTQGRD